MIQGDIRLVEGVPPPASASHPDPASNTRKRGRPPKPSLVAMFKKAVIFAEGYSERVYQNGSEDSPLLLDDDLDEFTEVSSSASTTTPARKKLKLEDGEALPIVDCLQDVGDTMIGPSDTMVEATTTPNKGGPTKMALEKVRIVGFGALIMKIVLTLLLHSRSSHPSLKPSVSLRSEPLPVCLIMPYSTFPEN